MQNGDEWEKWVQKGDVIHLLINGITAILDDSDMGDSDNLEMRILTWWMSEIDNDLCGKTPLEVAEMYHVNGVCANQYFCPFVEKVEATNDEEEE